MSDYMFLLENHLSAAQSRVVAEVQQAAWDANLSIFLTGGAMRDMLGGYPIRDIEFTVEGNAIKLAKTLASKNGASIVSLDESRKEAELLFPDKVFVRIGMARQERYARPGAKPQVTPATIHEDLRGRDFTVNSIALSLAKASRGLLLDPNNGDGDLKNKELRAVSNYTLYNDPTRLLRLIRLRVRLGFTIDDRTRHQVENVREAGLEAKIPVTALVDEFRRFADEPDPGELLAALEQEKLLGLFSPALNGQKLNLPTFHKLHKAKQLIPFGAEFPIDHLAVFLYLITEKLTPKEKSGLIKHLGLEKAEVALPQKMEAHSKKLERDLKSAKIHKASQLYALLAKAPGEDILFLFLRSEHRLVQDRIRNYLQKYLPAAMEITEKEVTAVTEAQPGSPKYIIARDALIATRLDARPKKVEPPPEEVPVVPSGPMGRRPPQITQPVKV